jgi:hypothetical protein
MPDLADPALGPTVEQEHPDPAPQPEESPLKLYGGIDRHATCQPQQYAIRSLESRP